MAATLWGGPGSCASHASAGALWGFPSFGPGPVEIVTRRTRGPRGVTLHRPADARWPRVRLVDGIAATDPARTLVDLSRRAPRALFESAFHHCVRTRLVTIAQMRRLSEGHAGRGAFGAPKLRAVLALYERHAAAPESPLEARLLRVLVSSRLPPPVRQHEVVLPGRIRRRLDFAWPWAQVALEADGYEWHSSPAAWAADRRRTRELRAAGWVILSATAGDLKDPAPLIDALARALADAERRRLHE